MNNILSNILIALSLLGSLLFFPGLILLIMGAAKLSERKLIFGLGIGFLVYVVLVFSLNIIFPLCCKEEDKESDEADPPIELNETLEEFESLTVEIPNEKSDQDDSLGISEHSTATKMSEKYMVKDSLESNSSNCVLCRSATKSCILVPCEEKDLCYSCGQYLVKEELNCPICDEAIESVWKI